MPSEIKFLKDLNTNVKVPGFERICDSKVNTARRLIWTVLLIILAGFMIFHLILRLNEFSFQPLITSMKQVRTKSLPLPAITVCDTKTLSSIELQLEAELATLNQMGNPPKTQQEWRRFIYGKRTPKAELIPYCEMGDLDGEPCTIAKFTEARTEGDYLTCYTYNYDGTAEIDGASIINGLMIFLKKGEGDDDDANETEPALEASFRLYVHHHHDIPVTLSGGIPCPTTISGISVTTGVRTEVAIKMTEFDLIENCDKGQKTLAYFKTYSQNFCEMECMANTSLLTAKCIPPNFPADVKQANVCSLKLLTDGFTAFLDAFRKAQDCSSTCPQRCIYTRYDNTVATIEMGKGTWRRFRNVTNSTISWPEFQKSIAGIIIYYPSMDKLKIVESKSITWLALLANVGGAMSLWMGIRLMTIFQVVDFVVLICGRVVKRPKKDASVTSSNKNHIPEQNANEMLPV